MYAKKDVMQPTEVWLIPSVSLERAEGLGRPVTNPGGYKVHFSHHIYHVPEKCRLLSSKEQIVTIDLDTVDVLQNLNLI